MAKAKPPRYGRVSYRGVTVDYRTRDALEWVARRLKDATGEELQLSQGSYNAGGVSASAGTHDGGGVIDCRTTPLSAKGRKVLLKALKDAGFAAWQRDNAPGVWGPHIHAVQVGNRKASSGARDQVKSYDARRDGLRGNRPDPTYRPSPPVRWAYKKGKPVPR